MNTETLSLFVKDGAVYFSKMHLFAEQLSGNRCRSNTLSGSRHCCSIERRKCRYNTVLDIAIYSLLYQWILCSANNVENHTKVEN